MLEVRIDDPMIVFIRQWQHHPIPAMTPHSTNDFPSSHGTKFAHLLINTTLKKKYKVSTKMDNRKSSLHDIMNVLSLIYPMVTLEQTYRRLTAQMTVNQVPQ